MKLAQLHAAGVQCWDDVLHRTSQIPVGLQTELLEEVRRSKLALDNGDIGYFVDALHPQDKWRVLSEFLDRTSFFDIETNGLDIDSTITVIVCWHRGELHTFVEHENLDDFLDLLDDVSLLASFNGASFDVPRVLDGFHIPKLPCPHLDLRWPCYHAGLTGGLKSIERQLGVTRPNDLDATDGELAIQLWESWRERADRNARDHLIRYCAADVLMLIVVAQHLSQRDGYTQAELWTHLPETSTPPPESKSMGHQKLVSNLFGTASPSKLRTRRRATG